ncbi:MAG: hypothetical protein IKE46_11830 [Selenomonadaceae bacterium]|nr:hypothetical protein [Selenomonadaceae bacterium]
MPANYNTNNLVKLGALQSLAQRTKTELDALDTKFSSAFRSMSVSGNTVSFFTSTDASGTAAATFNFPEEIFLDQLQTQFVSNFAFSTTTYPGATDPNLDGKPVFVLAVKGDATTNPTLTYSFVNVEYLVDTYTASDNSININGYTVNVKVSAAANNAITLQSDGLHVDISGKTDKVANATDGNFAGLDANGNLTDSGVAISADADVAAMITDVFGASGGGGNESDVQNGGE